MPKRSSFISAYSRQSSRTSQVRQTFLASLRRATLLGEERLGIGLRAQGALLPTRFLGVRVEEKQFSHGIALSTLGPVTGSSAHTVSKNTVGITRLSYTGSQGGIWYWPSAANRMTTCVTSAVPTTGPTRRTAGQAPVRQATRHALDHGAVGRRGRGPLPAGPPARRTPRRAARRRRRRRGHRRRQHRRRHLAARAEGLPRPRHRDVHPRRRASTPSAAGAGATRPGAPRRSWRRTAWSRPGSGSATATSPPTWCAPRCSTPATRCPQVTEALCRRWQPGACALLPMTDDRVETHIAIADPDSAERPPGRALPGVLGAAARRGARPRPWSWSASRSPPPAPGVIDAITDADLVVLPPSNPVVCVGTILGVPRVREALVATPRAGRRPLPHRRRHPRARHGRADAHRDRRRGQRRRRSACTTAPARPAGCWTAGWSTPSTPAEVRPGARPPASPAAPYR